MKTKNAIILGSIITTTTYLLTYLITQKTNISSIQNDWIVLLLLLPSILLVNILPAIAFSVATNEKTQNTRGKSSETNKETKGIFKNYQDNN